MQLNNMAEVQSTTVAVPEDAESKPKVTIAVKEEGSNKPEAAQPLPIFIIQKWWEAKCVTYAFVWPAVRARLERHMGSNLVRLTDKAYMRSLEDRIRRVNEENLARRIAAREQDEMERLKRLILCGKTPLKECPPELYHHPVFVFWRLVNEEVRAASKRRADAFYKKLKAFQRTSVLVLEDDLTYQSGKSEGPNVEVDSDTLLELCRQSVEAAQQLDMENGFIFTDAAYDSLKYEAENVKHLKKLTTVEELYHMADQIIGYPRVV